jgi:translation initiation factor IF-2
MKLESQNLIPRPPIVVVMGHIDHGKTTLLDFIRKTKVAEKESGGITQHIGAYEIEHQGKRITFIDTPGHEAFSKMRQRGARIADLAILVIAADDGVKAQTTEALSAIKEAKIPFIVAVNKIDKENANPERVKRELAEKEIYVENLGGKTPSVNISAKTGQGVHELLEMIILVSEMEELKADPNCPTSGVVIESHLDSKRGIAATLIIQNGTLKKKMFINASGAIAPVKIFESFAGQPLEEATFSSPVKIVGFDKLPDVGINFRTYETKNEAENAKLDELALCPIAGTFKKTGESQIVIPLIIKADTTGSLEALEKEIMKLSTPETGINILRMNAGNVNEDDVKFASSGQNPIIVGFRVKAESGIAQMAERNGVTMAFFDIIYKISEWLEEEIKKRTPENVTEEILGTAELIKVFKQEKNRQIIGGKVLSGKIVNGKYVKISRRGTQIAKGKILELQHFKMKVSEVEEGKEFGALIEIKTELAKGDLIEIYDAKTPGKS